MAIQYQAQDQPQMQRYTFVPSLFLSGLNTPVCVQLLINKPEFTLGRSEQCDGVLSFNNEIGRLHCRILFRGGEYEIEDCESTNGTYLNGNILKGNKRYKIKEGDQIQLSTSTFQIERIHRIPPEVG